MSPIRLLWYRALRAWALYPGPALVLLERGTHISSIREHFQGTFSLRLGLGAEM